MAIQHIDGEGQAVTFTPTGVVKTPLTAEQEEARAVEQVQVLQNRADELAAYEQKGVDKASAKVKLIAGEALTEAEADAIVL